MADEAGGVSRAAGAGLGAQPSVEASLLSAAPTLAPLPSEGTLANIFTPPQMAIPTHYGFTAKFLYILMTSKTYPLFLCLIR